MPLVRIDLRQGTTPEHRQTVGQIVYESMLEILNVPKNDRFQVITEHSSDSLIFDPSYLGIERSDRCIFIQITLNAGRTLEQKQAFYRVVAEGLHHRLQLRTEDTFISLVEVPKENWSFGNGIAQYATPK